MIKAKTMYQITEEAQTKLQQKSNIENIASSLNRYIEAKAKAGETNVKVATGFLPFTDEFLVTMTNLNLVANHVRSFGYKVNILLNERTNELVFYIDWGVSPLEKLFEEFGTILDPEAQF